MTGRNGSQAGARGARRGWLLNLMPAVDAWLRNVAEASVTYPTLHKYRQDVRRICKHAGGVKLQALTAQRI